MVENPCFPVAPRQGLIGGLPGSIRSEWHTGPWPQTLGCCGWCTSSVDPCCWTGLTSCRTVCRIPESEQMLALATSHTREMEGAAWLKPTTASYFGICGQNESKLDKRIQILCPHPRPEDMVGPEPRSPLLDVFHHSLGIGVHRLLGDGQAHVGVNSIFRWVRE